MGQTWELINVDRREHGLAGGSKLMEFFFDDMSNVYQALQIPILPPAVDKWLARGTMVLQPGSIGKLSTELLDAIFQTILNNEEDPSAINLLSCICFALGCKRLLIVGKRHILEGLIGHHARAANCRLVCLGEYSNATDQAPPGMLTEDELKEIAETDSVPGEDDFWAIVHSDSDEEQDEEQDEQDKEQDEEDKEQDEEDKKQDEQDEQEDEQDEEQDEEDEEQDEEDEEQDEEDEDPDLILERCLYDFAMEFYDSAIAEWQERRSLLLSEREALWERLGAEWFLRRRRDPVQVRDRRMVKALATSWGTYPKGPNVLLNLVKGEYVREATLIVRGNDFGRVSLAHAMLSRICYSRDPSVADEFCGEEFVGNFGRGPWAGDRFCIQSEDDMPEPQAGCRFTEWVDVTEEVNRLLGNLWRAMHWGEE